MSDINEQLRRLRNRRVGSDRKDSISPEAYNEIIAKSLYSESWETRGGGKPHTKYAIGAMQEVDKHYTRISVETAKRVEAQLEKRLANFGISAQFRLQGSVPLNVHIRGVSDVDLVTLDTDFLIYATSGKKSQDGGYVSSEKSSLGVLLNLRNKSEIALRAAFPAATIVAGDKAINLCGASLARPVDVVPAHWWDTIGYQETFDESARGVYILASKTSETLNNLPFTHIKKISDACDNTFGGMRKAIRLCKNVKADAELDGEEIQLSSYDIAATMYHADIGALRLGSIYELSILSETQRHLDFLTVNEDRAKILWVPDGSRLIFNTPEKLAALRRLSIRLDDLLRKVANENLGPYNSRPIDTLPQGRDLVTALML